MNKIDTSELYSNEIILNTASQEGGEWMKLVEAWCTDLRSRDMRTIDTKTIINFFERFYIIHEKIHHRVILIRACMMNDPTCIEELVAINNLDNRFLREQKRITKIIQSLRSKTFFGELHIAYNTKNYMQYIHGIIDDFQLDWSILPSGGLIYDPVDTLTDSLS